MKVLDGNKLAKPLKTLALALAILCACSLHAVERLYWANFDAGTIAYGNQTGGALVIPFAGELAPCGTALDPSTGKIYWGSALGLRKGNLDGSGVPVTIFDSPSNTNVCGVAIDSINKKIYWTRPDNEEIRVGNLDGSGFPITLFTENTGSEPTGLVVDPFIRSKDMSVASERFHGGYIYWTNSGTNQVRFGHISGRGIAENFALNEISATGIALDVNARRLYWANSNVPSPAQGQIRTARIDNIGGPMTLLTTSSPVGVAIDVASGFIYWGDNTLDKINRATLQGTNPTTLFTVQDGANFPSILQPPFGTQDPVIYGSQRVGALLTCTTGKWATDDFRAFLFRAPTTFSYRWFVDGTVVSTANFLVPSDPGLYTCEVTATNAAGSRSLLSLPRRIAECLLDGIEEDGVCE